ncbi:EAL domain-containing protein [Rhizobium sp. TRM96647]|uniref:sensor domain-containing protein n=1 Tax=unclassified Rhizobium TaxID=2613769 RepID=UPI0021E88FB1|nr:MULTISPECIES: EAL domain-containing protein [unclassified Rhizobium]MCV3736915.1 EAL domain-containing protein [Rhizobium sp. TRM96647]MCV3756685.1 EAL domain-containing protein [Rhizobium sp. TRM96650]
MGPSRSANTISAADLPEETAFRHSPFGMGTIDAGLRFVSANPALLRMFAAAGVEDLPPLDRIAFDDVALALPEASPTGDIEKPREMRIRRLDGSALWCLLSILDVGRADAPAFLLQIVDIDERKRRELDLADRESRWNHALESAGQGVWDHDFARGELFYSRQWKAIRGMAPDEAVDGTLETWIQNVHPDDRARVLVEIERQESAEAVFNVFSYRERHRDGHWVWIESRGAVVEYGPDGRPSRIAGTDTDITGRRKAEERMAQLSRRLELALDISRIGVFESNLHDKTVAWDERIRQIYGKTTGAIGRTDWEDSIHPADRDHASAVVAKAIESGAEYSQAFRIVRGEDEIRHIRSRGVTFVDADGVPRLVGANWDVTEDVLLQQELQRAKDLAEARSAALEEAQARLQHNALHDHLTQLPNRRYLDVALEERSIRAAATGTRLSILHIDLDRFKEINDTLGHSAGDGMLTHAARVLRAHMGPQDFVARIGGDEFVFLVCGPEKRNLGDLAERIVTAMRQPVTFEGHVCRFGASIGIASAAGPLIDGRQLLINADLALYRAKNKGRSRHEFFTSEFQAQIIVSKKTADEIMASLEQRRFLPYYQPQFCARTLEVAGIETLARWDHPERGILAPAAFLPIAEDINAVGAIDRQILERALFDLAAWDMQGVVVPKLSVNVSSRRLQDPDLCASLRALPLQAGRLSFELLESIFLDDCDPKILESLAEIRKLGIDIEVDDFGTGHASIVSLMKLLPRRLKIDRQLVKPIVRSQAQRRLVGTIIEIGRSLDITVTAEGVETAAHVRLLQEMGCDLLQGYALARPMPALEIVDFIRSERWREVQEAAPDLPERLTRSW